MELFKLLGTIAIDNAGAKKALKETSEEGGKAESKLSKAFSGIGKGAAVVGKTIATGLAVGAGAVAPGIQHQMAVGMAGGPVKPLEYVVEFQRT